MSYKTIFIIAFEVNKKSLFDVIFIFISVRYPCKICPVAYDNLKSLTAHMKVHKARLGR